MLHSLTHCLVMFACRVADVERPPDARAAVCAALHAADCEAAPQHPGRLTWPDRRAEPAPVHIPGAFASC